MPCLFLLLKLQSETTVALFSFRVIFVKCMLEFLCIHSSIVSTLRKLVAFIFNFVKTAIFARRYLRCLQIPLPIISTRRNLKIKASERRLVNDLVSFGNVSLDVPKLIIQFSLQLGISLSFTFHVSMQENASFIFKVKGFSSDRRIR